MNYLAHLYLSEPDPEALVGNLAVDFFRGPRPPSPSAAYDRGVDRHRRIDVYTDTHATFLTSCRRLPGQFRRYSPVIIDVVYDHFLAINWATLSGVPLAEFTEWVYAQLQRQQAILPAKLQQVLPRMIEHDWLGSYVHLESIERALFRLSQRSKREIHLDHSLPALREHHERLNEDFLHFFPELLAHVAEDNQPVIGREAALP